MHEKAIESNIIHFLHAMGAHPIKIQCGTLYKEYKDKNGVTRRHKIKLAERGNPDIVACVGGRFVGIEVKRDEKEIEKWYRQNDARSIAQMAMAQRIQQCGGHMFLTHSIEDLEAQMKEEGLLENGEKFLEG